MTRARACASKEKPASATSTNLHEHTQHTRTRRAADAHHVWKPAPLVCSLTRGVGEAKDARLGVAGVGHVQVRATAFVALLNRQRAALPTEDDRRVKALDDVDERIRLLAKRLRRLHRHTADARRAQE